MESVGAELQFRFYVIRSAHRRNLSAQNPLGLNKSCRKPQIITSNNARFVRLLSNAGYGGLFEERC